MNKRVMFLALGMMIIFGVQFVAAAEPTHQYIKQYMDPLYRQNLDDGTQYPYTLVIDTPDGITEVVSAMLTLQVWHNPTVRYYVTVDGQTCNTEEFLVHTTYANAGEGTVYFDCSNVITGEGTYEVLLWTDDDTGSSTFWADITYSNRPMGTATVHGTEYRPGDRAKLWVQLLDASGDDVEDGACQIDIYTPVNTVLIEDGAMTNMHHDGIYYYDLLAPQSHGVYPAIAKCYYDIMSSNEYADSFSLIEGTIDNGDYTDTWALDGDEHKMKQDSDEIEFTYDFDNMCGITTDELLLSGISVNVNAKWTESTTNDNIIISIYNFTSSSWINLPNRIIDPNDRLTVSNFISTNNITKAGLVDGSGTLRLHFEDTLKNSGDDKKIEMDLVEVACEEFSSPIWTEVKGSSEMHISGDYRWVTQVETGQVFDDAWPGEFHYNVTLSSQTSQTEEDEHIFIELPTPFPCHHVISLSVDGVDTPFIGHDPLIPATAGCSVEWDQDLDAATNYDIQIISENYFKEVESTWITEAAFDYSMIKLACTNYQIANNLSAFTLPLTAPPEIIYADDEFMAVCADYLDTYHHWNYTYWNEFRTTSGVFSETDMHGLNEMWRHMEFLVDRLQRESTNILGGLTTGGMYSGAIVSNPTGQPVPSWATYWASSSMTFVNYQQLAGITLGLTNVSVDTSGIADSIWGYTGTVSPSLLSQFTTSIWGATTRTLTAFSLWDHETAADYVWNDSNRTLTEAPFDPALIANATWSFDQRTLTGQQQTWVGGTEYSPDEETGKVVVRLVDGTDTPVDNALCILRVATPDNTLAFELNMTHLVGATMGGVYVGDFDLPNETGVYPYGIDCEIVSGPSPKHYYLLDAFHIFGANETKRAEIMWNYPDRTLTEAPFDPQLIANATWNFENRTLTNFIDLTNYTFIQSLITDYGNALTAQLVWDYADRNLTYYPAQTDLTNYTLVQELINSYSNNITEQSIWEYVDRTLTSAPFNAEAIANATWNFNDRTLTSTALDLTNYTLIQSLVTNYGNDLTAQLIWDYAGRNLTYYPAQVDLTNYTLVEELVETHSVSAQSIWEYVNRTLTEAPFDPQLIANATWNFNDRTLTSTTLDLTNYTYIQDLIIAYGNDLTAQLVWDYAERNLTYYPLDTDLTNYTQVEDLIAAYANDITEQDVWEYNNRSLTASPFDPAAIWSYSNRSLTEFNFISNLNTTELTDDIWNHSARYTHGVELN